MNKLIPFGERILVKRKTVGEKVGKIVLPEDVAERATDLAVVTFIPEASLVDDRILEMAPNIVEALVQKSSEGDSDALIALLRLGEFCKLRSIKVGDEVMISKYVGVDFHETGSNEQLTLVNMSDIIGLVVKNV
jgi:co-chaperonin GroES (HSP10)